ncbi:MAG: hypothetical protein SPL13_01460 [Clostridia bacterium]|nr:hypothetical protein [Clostridia bacterium]
MAVNKKTLVKTISIITLVSVIVAALIGLGLLFKIISVDFWIGRILLSCLTLAVAGILGFNSIRAITSGNKIGLIAGILIPVSAGLFLVLIWLVDVLGSFYQPFLYVVVIISSISILMNVIISNVMSMGKSLILLQVIYYLLISYIILTLDFVIFGNLVLINHWMIFGAVVIVAIALFAIFLVKKKNIFQNEAEQRVAEGYVKITVEEYEGLKAEVARLKALVGETDENK